MRNNFNFNVSIKMKDLDKMESLLNLLDNEKIDNEDYQLCIGFKNLLNSFNNTPKVKLYDLINSFAQFYETFLYPYCKGKIMCEYFTEFDFEQIQYVMDKMKEIIYTLSGQYGL